MTLSEKLCERYKIPANTAELLIDKLGDAEVSRLLDTEDRVVIPRTILRLQSLKVELDKLEMAPTPELLKHLEEIDPDKHPLDALSEMFLERRL